MSTDINTLFFIQARSVVYAFYPWHPNLLRAKISSTLAQKCLCFRGKSIIGIRHLLFLGNSGF